MMTCASPSTDSTLEVVSARFADLVAQDYQHRQLEQITRGFFAVSTEDMLSTALVQGLTQRGGVRQAAYYRNDGEGRFILVYQRGPHPVSVSEFTLCDAPSGGELLPKIAQSLVTPTPAAPSPRGRGTLDPSALQGCYPLRQGEELMALVLVEREPSNYILRDFAQRLAERAAQALTLIRYRSILECAKEQVVEPSPPQRLHWMEDWSNVLLLLEDRYRQLEELLANAVIALGADKGSLMLYDEATRELVVRAVCGIEPSAAERIRRGEEPCLRLRLGEGVAGKVAQTLEPMIVNQADRDPLFLEPQLSQVGSILCLPLHVGGLTLGVLNLTHRSSGRRFVSTHLETGMRLAQQASQALNNSRLYHLAILEPMTEIFHRAHLYHRAEDEILRARRYQRHVSLIAVHLNELDAIRRNKGHEVGNRVEIEFAKLLKRSIRETDAVGRLGEGSFAVLLPETDSLGAMFLAERIHQEADIFPLLAELSITTSLGVCTFPDRADNVQRFFARAEAAMAEASRTRSEMPVYLAPALEAEFDSSRYNSIATLARAV